MPEVVYSPLRLATLIEPGVAAVGKYWRPFLLLQTAALGLVVAYYSNHRVQDFCGELSQIKARIGWPFTALSTAIAGALLPELAKAAVMGDRRITARRLRDVVFAFCIFAINGVLTDLQYRLMAWLYGNDAHPLTILKKVLTDQFVTTPGYSMPYWVLAYRLRFHRYNPIKTIGEISPRWYATRALPLLIPAWCYWIPMVLLIYSLPVQLQFCLFCFAVAAWSLLMVCVATHEQQLENQPM